MSVAIRVHSLRLTGPGPRSLAAMERHGKRLDMTSQMRRVRDLPPLVFRSLDLTDAFARHVQGCRRSAALRRPVLHAIVQCPPEFLAHDATRADRESLILSLAIQFINQTHGGEAVFAARLDRDEEGLCAVDLFYSPRYKKRTKRGEEIWISTTRHGKLLAQKHRAEIERRNGGVFSTTPRNIGIALQAELHAFFAQTDHFALRPRVEKVSRWPDRIEPEVYKLRREERVAALPDQVDALADMLRFALDRKPFNSTPQHKAIWPRAKPLLKYIGDHLKRRRQPISVPPEDNPDDDEINKGPKPH